MVDSIDIFPLCFKEWIWKHCINWKNILKERGISYTIELIPILYDFSDLPRKTGTESVHHLYLKKLAAQLLRELGEEKPVFEWDLKLISTIDVYSPTLKIGVECGHTYGEIIINYIRNQTPYEPVYLKEIWLLEYPIDGKSRLIKFVIPEPPRKKREA